ncbi:polyketide cyclase [Rhodanobacter sp. FW510-R12]|uniref:polyketide cyclase n=1 Tax=unclassified Rhodanobacter TaxID=2621553 RepID=UPI0007AA1C96|nr:MULTISPECIES: polyketide cyclase [unclassified Rhodanobacter]KZC15658.1 polyketide cyclase [Rhodanobacter sp. FW104-R8]KZC25683.1 polyketide cyclase [Rhodanobacter sp. FW510-T8]KZC32889.1 polyketide cyclase [Rhodanobacter sp. FW510-R10]
MMRVFEFLVALVIVALIGVLAAVVMPGSGHVERQLVIGKDMRQVYDVLDNYRRLPDYAVLRSLDPNVQFSFSGKSYGPGAEVSWTSSDAKLGNGGLTIASATPEFDKIDGNTKSASIVWNLDNNWRGLDKHFTLDLERQGSRGQLTQVTWSYDVSYGWNLINRFANLYIHGDPDAFIQFSLNNLQNVLAGVPNIDYSQLIPYIEQTQPTPVLMVSTSIERKNGIEAVDDAVAKANTEVQAAAKKLGVHVTGSRILITTNYGDQTFSFDVAYPIDSSTLTVNGQAVQLTAAAPPSLDAAAPATAGSTAAVDSNVAVGSRDRYGRLVVDGNVRATLAFGGAALKGIWNGTFAGVPQTRDMLKAYAQTHGYKFDDVVNRPYDVVLTPEVKDAGGNITTYAKYAVYLPISNAPEKTPEQEAGLQPPSLEGAPAAAAPAPAGSAAAPAKAASAGK